MARVYILKPDGIGDFVLATGAIRLLAREYGEENLLLAVKSLLVPLAKSQFPRATVVALPVAAERKVLNLFLRNFLACLPAWWQIRRQRVELAVCFRSMRNYLETFLFLSARAKRHLANENILLRGKRRVRLAVEHTANRLFGTELSPYPTAAGEAPMEIEAHRRILEQILRRPVSTSEVLPSITAPHSLPENSGTWICAPITNLASKLYPASKWQKVFAELLPEAAHKKILLVGSPDQKEALRELLSLLTEAGCTKAEICFPEDLVAFVALIAGAELLLTVDTAAAHFATALDRPTLIVFSGLHRGMFGPWQRSHRQIWMEPCALPPGQAGQGKKKWHAGIAPDRVAEEVRSLLRDSRDSRN